MLPQCHVMGDTASPECGLVAEAAMQPPPLAHDRRRRDSSPHAPASKLQRIGRYDLTGEVLGSGAFGTVYLGIDSATGDKARWLVWGLRQW